MPLALSRTARTLNSWAPHGEISVVGLNGTFKKDLLEPSVDLLPDPVYLPQKGGQYNNGLANGQATRKQERRRQKSAALQAIEMNLAPYRNGVVNQGFFAEEPKPKYQDSPPATQKEKVPVRSAVPFANGVAPISVQSQNNLNVRYGAPGSTKRRRFSSAGTPTRTVFPDASVQCGSALVLATGSQQSIGHLRKWNSQTLLGATSQDMAADPDLRVPERTSLRRNASLPDLRLAEQLDATRLHRARPPSGLEETAPLMRSPSDTGRALCFWVQEGEDQGVKAFHDMPAERRAKYEKKIALYRQHHQVFNGFSKSSPGKSTRGPSWLQVNGEDGQADLLNFSPRSLAQELTLLGRELLLAVEPAELLTYVMKPRMAEVETCPNLHRLLQFYERLSAVVTSEILRGPTPSKRAQILAMLIETAERCHALQNWQSCRALLSGIRSPPAVRLKDTWDQLKAEYPDHFSMFESLLLDCPQQEDSSFEGEGGRPRPLAAIPYFGEIVARVRARPTVNRLRPARALWREPPSLAKWVDEQTSSPTECDQCQSRMHKNRACCYLVSFVLGKNFFCPVRRMPLQQQPDSHANHGGPMHDSSADLSGDANVLQRLHLAQLFDDPDTLPFTSRLVQCCALQPGNMVHVRQRAEIVLRTAQATARAYDLENNPNARYFWLNQTYSTMLGCMKRSAAVEPQRSTNQRFKV